MLTVTKLFEFESSHHLPDYDGKCRNLHGHTFKLEVEVSGTMPDNSIGSVEYPTMIIDFSKLKEIVKERIIDKLDHQYLNEHFAIPTSETICSWIALELHCVFGEYLERVRLWETSTSYSEWRK